MFGVKFFVARLYFFPTLYRDGGKEDEYQISEIIKIIAPSSSSSPLCHRYLGSGVFVQLQVHFAAKCRLAKLDSCFCCVFFVTEIIPYATCVPFGNIIVIYYYI